MPPVQVRENVPLAPLTTLDIGGPARFLVEAANEGEIAAALDFARARGCPAFVLGGGSNVLVSDDGYPGVVVRVALRGVRGLDDTGAGPVRVAAGENWDSFVQAAVERDWAGIECLSGIPGSTGGTPVQNVGAYGQEVSEVISAVRALDRDTLATVEIAGSGCGFAYRSSIFNTIQANRYVIVSVDFVLKKKAPPRVEYPDLRRRFEGRSGSPSLAEAREAVLQTRKAKAMVLIPGDPDSRSAGSFFRNPIVSCAEFRSVVEAATTRGILPKGEVPPSYPGPDGRIKLPAAWLIERAGFTKGYARGRAAISTRHTLALVNRGGATAREVLALAREIQDGVRDRFGIALLPEPVFVGF